MTTEEKVYKNALIAEKLVKLTRTERQEVLSKLLENTTQRALAIELGIPRSTIHDWVSLRQNNTGASIHISFNAFYQKITNCAVEDITDWGRLEQIKTKIEELLRQRNR